MSILDNEGHDSNGLGNRPGKAIPISEFYAVQDMCESFRTALHEIAAEASDSSGAAAADRFQRIARRALGIEK